MMAQVQIHILLEHTCSWRGISRSQPLLVCSSMLDYSWKIQSHSSCQTHWVPLNQSPDVSLIYLTIHCENRNWKYATLCW